MKLLFVIDTLGGGGAEKILVDLVAEYSTRGHKVKVLAIVDKGVHKRAIQNYAFYDYVVKDNKFTGLTKKIVNVAKLLPFKIFPSRLLYRLLIREKFDIEVAFIEGISTKLVSGSDNPNSKKVAWVHTDFETNHYSRKYFATNNEELRSYLAYDKIICVSGTVRDNFVRRTKIADRVIVRYNPVNEKAISDKANANNIGVPRAKHRPVLLSIGRLTSVKGYDRLLEVHKKLITEGFYHELWIMGEGEEDSNLRMYIDENDLQVTAKLLGFKDNPYVFIKTCDLFVCSSRVEGYSTAIMEALILGKPVLSTECSGTKELLNDGEYGLIVENNNDGLYKGIKQLLSNHHLLQHYERKAKERSKQFKMVERIKEIDKSLGIN